MHNQPTIPTAVIFTALTVEYQAARSHVDNPRTKEHPEGAIYELGTFISPSTHWHVGLVQTQMGTARAAFEAGRAIDYFKPSLHLLAFLGEEVLHGLEQKETQYKQPEGIAK